MSAPTKMTTASDEVHELYRSQPISKIMCSLELGAATPAECYEFAGRFRREFLSGHHCLVGILGWQLVMRTNRHGKFREPTWHSLEWLEGFLRERLGTEKQEEF